MDDKTRADVMEYLMTGGAGEMLALARCAEWLMPTVSISTETAIVILEMVFEEAKRRAN
jgi:hypothetical protein